ncbi:MAG: hypothetical protein PHD06_11320 [Bacteroidales bacterium]|nr:hypothetical protein [Bacteroidales bacterium]
MPTKNRLAWAVDILNPDNPVATPNDKMKAWLYLKEYLAVMLNE